MVWCLWFFYIVSQSIEYFEKEIRDPSCDPVMKEKYKKIVKELKANRSNFLEYVNDYEESLAKEQALLNELMAQRKGTILHCILYLKVKSNLIFRK